MMEFGKGYGILLLYFAVCATAAFLLRRRIRVHKEVFRKTLHMILLGTVFILTSAFQTWWTATIACVIFMAMVYPILYLAEKIPGYSDLLTERKNGEIKNSLLVVFTMYAMLISLGWGLLGEKYLVIASVLAWGLGDAAAALVGKRFGKIYIEGKLVEGRKSLEGSLAMFFVSSISVWIVLTVYGVVHLQLALVVAIVTAAVSATVELYTKNGMDTITCPMAAASTMILMLQVLGG
ncbi:phosphatidate cytidylyltransferase [Alkalibacter rhizosphaerae]|uniref:Phosphatidate cytidylyltransferase n=1 Tax=Alkalibacter rhizosphaerae TaxID=2815577 RepID=A0A974XE86_9FIRM|nr:phosphatidate cytidylyltransferase [Alkalibacter rhizosphaerae]QSX08237.1 phosphatidate cytidylyltransferase [Alkalibacter rhizosphaerae]